ncbi:MAG TPA: hypothetical protein VHX88_14790 [Solirubrobacteraceae bacterium]|jgi:hypothetical protein|nr:hypothetical protein [Solirubrobacteraceae bacterium]
MTSDGSPYARFRRALERGNLAMVRAAAAELPRIDLADALEILLLIGAADQPTYDRAATRWLARFALERPSARLDDLRRGLYALEALPYNPQGARSGLRALCREHDLEQVARRL